MRTTLDLPEELVDEARRSSHLGTKREVVIAGLEELIKKARREELRSLAGKIVLRVDLPASRRR
jgi:Arc/MetJ family transcription regulator